MPSKYVLRSPWKRRRVTAYKKSYGGHFVRTYKTRRRCPTARTVKVYRLKGYKSRVAVSRRGGGRCYTTRSYLRRRSYA